MIGSAIKRLFRRFGYEIHRIDAPAPPQTSPWATFEPPAIEATWPLPRRGKDSSDDEIRACFARYERWHYAYEFEGGLAFARTHPTRPLQRFRHFMPYVIESQGGSLQGKRVLDVACNSGFWSIQCALLGADVIGIDARPELIEQANLIKSITGVSNVDFKVLDFWQITPEALGGQFDVVLNLGLLYHLSEPHAALQITQSVARKTVLLDTALFKSEIPLTLLSWEKSADIRHSARDGMVARPSRRSIELILHDLEFKDWFEIPIRGRDLPQDYLQGYRASWLLEV